MADIKQQLKDDMKAAMRDKDATRLDTVRMVRAAIQRKEVDERTELGDEEILAVVSKLVKQCNDAASQFDQAGRDDLAEKERANIAFMEAYLPEQLGDAEIDEIIDRAIAETGASSMKDMGKVMGIVRGQFQGRADMGEVSGRIKARLG